jgi:sRNA-binding regulator protein Hfq
VNHGYSWSMPITQKGKYVTCVTSMPLPGNPAPGTVLGCTTQTYTPVSIAPVGAYEKATATKGTLSLVGWAADATSLSTSNQVKIDVYLPNGQGTVATITASVPRPELNVAVPGLGVNHGYSWSMPITLKGKYVTCVTSMPLPGNAAPGTVLGCTTQTYTPVSIAPIGAYEKATASAGTLALTGWSADATSLSTSNQVKIDVYLPNGQGTVATITASVPRPELNVAVPGLGVNHGYSWSMPITLKGKYVTCVTSMPLPGNPAPGTVLGCTTQTYTPVSIAPIGAYEKATASAGTLALTGWSADATSITTSNKVKIDVYFPNGQVTVASITASVPRPELNVAVPGLGVNHGYSWSMPITQKGKYVTCVTSMPLPGNPAPGTVLGCTTQTY